MADRGEYRSLYVSFWDNADVHRLSDRAYRVLTTLRGTLGGAGIGVVYAAVLATRCGCTVEQLEPAYQELERVKPGESLGWIVRESNIVWVVNALEYEPTLSDGNGKHRTHVQRQLAALGVKPRLAAAFRAHYPTWFRDEPVKPDSVGDRVSDGYTKPNAGVTKHRTEGDGTSQHITVPPSPARAALLARFKGVPAGEAVLTRFLDERPASKDELPLIRSIEGWLEGMAMPANKPASPAVVVAALSDYLAEIPHPRDYGSKHIRSFVVRELNAPPATARANGTAKPKGPPQTYTYGDANGAAAEQEIVWTDTKAQ